MNKKEVETFKVYKDKNKDVFQGLKIFVDCCDIGISASMNKGIRFLSSD